MNDFLSSKKMTDEEIKAFFLKNAGSRISSFDKETNRLRKAIEDFKVEWIQKTINKFLDSDQGKIFLEEHREEDPKEILKIMLAKTNLGTLWAKARSNKIAVLKGKVE